MAYKMHAVVFTEGVGLGTCEDAKHPMAVRPEPFVSRVLLKLSS